MYKNKVMKKATAIILLLSLLLTVSALVSCGDNEITALSVKGVE